eukprot:gene41215-39532_t
MRGTPTHTPRPRYADPQRDYDGSPRPARGVAGCQRQPLQQEQPDAPVRQNVWKRADGPATVQADAPAAEAALWQGWERPERWWEMSVASAKAPLPPHCPGLPTAAVVQPPMGTARPAKKARGARRDEPLPRPVLEAPKAQPQDEFAFRPADAAPPAVIKPPASKPRERAAAVSAAKARGR